MSFARRIDGEMTLQLLALSTRIVLRMMAGQAKEGQACRGLIDDRTAAFRLPLKGTPA